MTEKEVQNILLAPPPPFQPGEMDKNENKFPTRIHNGKSDIFFIYSEVIGTFCTINQHYH